MVMYCKRCGKAIEGTKGHAGGVKAVLGALIFGPVGASVEDTHELAKEEHGDGLCTSCRLFRARMKAENPKGWKYLVDKGFVEE